jgi:hypothetical protein
MYGLKHLINCQCILPQFKNTKNPPFHRFVVFSVVDNEDKVEKSYAQCNNCGVVHSVFEIGKSDIIQGRDEINSIPSIEDIRLMIPEGVSNVLTSYKCDLATWQHVQFILDNDLYESHVVLTKEFINDEITGKLFRFVSKGKYKIESFSHKDSI